MEIKFFNPLKSIKKMKRATRLLLIGVVVGIVLTLVLVNLGQKKEKEAVAKTISTLEKNVQVSELSTYTSIYNGIATVTDPEKPEKVKYYVSYEARIDAGLDFSAIKMEGDLKNARIVVTLPDIRLQEPAVDVSSLDYLFMDDKANQSAVTADALKACVADVEVESKEEKAILEMAEQNAKNVLRALMEPMLEQDLPDYQLVFAGEEEQS